MNWVLATALVMISGPPGVRAQTLDRLNLQAHGYVAQGFLASTANNWNTTHSSAGSAAWTDAVVNVNARPTAKLTLGAQGRYFLLGSLSNKVTLDWAQADCKFNEYFGVRAGKVKSPTGLFNEEQDIDPAYIWVLLPESIYPVASRNSLLTHYGGVLYGRAVLGERLGKLQYRGFGGERVLASNDGALQPLRDTGLNLPNGLKGPVFGATLRWETPVRGMMLGASENIERTTGIFEAGPLSGVFRGTRFYRPYFFTKYERNKTMIAAEYSRINILSQLVFPVPPPINARLDARSFYAMASYGFSRKLTAGLYYSSENNRQIVVSAGRYKKDWAICGRYDFSGSLYAKLEQHVIDGTLTGYSSSDNPNGLQPNSRMTLLKIGVSF